MASAATTVDEAFIPVSKYALLERLARHDEWPENQHQDCTRFYHYLVAWRHQDYRDKLNRLKHAYLPFSPDRDTIRVLQFDDEQRDDLQRFLIRAITALMERANYTRLRRDDINAILQENSPFGLEVQVDLSEYDEILLFARGSGSEPLQYRSLKTLYLKQHRVQRPSYQRLFLLLKMKPVEQRLREIMKQDEVSEKKARKILDKKRVNLPDQLSHNNIYLKLFKNIPKADLGMLFPTTTVKLKSLDKIKLGVTAGGGTGASVMATATKLATAANPMAAAGALGGLAAVIFRQVTKIISQRNKYMMMLAQKLFFHNLANNRGVLTLLIDRAEEEEVKEALLLYYFLSHGQYNDNDNDTERLGADIEQFLFAEYGVKVNFDIDAALALLKQDGLLEAPNGILTVPEPTAAAAFLEKHWLSRLTRQNSQTPEDMDF